MCKYYQGAEDKALEKRLKALFGRVHREKPESSRSVRIPKLNWTPSTNLSSQESREGYFVGLKRKKDATRDSVFATTE